LRRPYIAPIPANKGLSPQGSGAKRPLAEIVKRNTAVRRYASIVIRLYLGKSQDFRLRARLDCFRRIQALSRK
jgi:hypothetical protein